MKTYLVRIHITHESFGGYEISDGFIDYDILARNSKSAENKAIKKFKKDSAMYSVSKVFVMEKVPEEKSAARY